MRCAKLGVVFSLMLAWPLFPALATDSGRSAKTAKTASDRGAAPASPSAAERDAKLWQDLGQVQRSIPAPASSRRPFASVDVKGKGGQSEPRVVIRQRDETGGSFTVARIVYTLDGHLLAKQSSAKGLPSKLEVFDGRVFPGQHTLRVRVVMRGNDYGIFSYMKGYRVAHDTARAFRIADRGMTTVTVRIKERATDDMKRKFYVDIGLGRQPAAATPSTARR